MGDEGEPRFGMTYVKVRVHTREKQDAHGRNTSIAWGAHDYA